jgi:hypothetical protein
MESNLCLHLGFCAQSSENCLKGTTEGVHALFRDTSTRAELGTKIQANLWRWWKSCDSLLENSELTTSDTGAVVDWLSIESCGQRDAHFKGSDLHAQLLISAQGFVPVFRRTGSAHLAKYAGKVLLGFETARYGNIQHAHFSGAQHLFRALDTIPEEALVRGLAGRIAEDLREMRCAEPNCTRHFLEA